jgi:molybdopterin converting factor subunit 1
VHGREPSPPPPSPPATATAELASARVSVLYFAALRDLAHTAEEQVELRALPSSVAELLRELEARHEALQGRLQAVRVAVNEEFVGLDTQLMGGEVVALIPPVSGG